MNRIPTLITSATLTALLGTACVEQPSLRGDAYPGGGRASSADDLLIVDCMLPGQVRQLGTQLTYLSARRPIQTTRQDCAIRGGEYVAYDRADYGTALGVWQPLAEQGDADAQNKLGEIYERGLGGRPDYAMAAVWYRRAAEQGLTRAQINLGFLYEKGLGVDKDLKLALQWYRKASRLPDAVALETGQGQRPAATPQQQTELAALRRELENSREELEQARRELRKREQELRRERDRGPAAQEPRPSQGSATPDADTRRKLADQDRELARRQEQIQTLEARARQQQERLLSLETEGASLKEQLTLVRAQSDQTQQDLRRYQQLANESESQLARTRADLQALANRQGRSDTPQLQALQQRLNQREQALREQDQTVTQLRDKLAELERKLTASGGSQAEVSQMRDQLQRTQDELNAAQALAAERERALRQAQEQLQAQKSAQPQGQEQVVGLEEQLRAREKNLAEQRDMIARLRQEAEQWQRKLQQLESKRTLPGDALAARTASTEVPVAAPSIQLIEPPLVGVRGEGDLKVPIKRGLDRRTIVGQVSAPAGLYTLTLNGARIKPNAKGLFENDIRIGGEVTPVSLVAVDGQGRRATLGFSLVTDGSGEPIARRANPLADLDLGNFHALVIGNQDYAHLPDLDTSKKDAEEVARILRDKFGFKTNVLINANRYQILSALNQLRGQLTEKDNLLVYYAGHGELDRVNLRGHWLPVDAEKNSDANWISNVAITDILNAMSVRQVLLVADSCYSGALTRSALTQLDVGQSEDARRHWLKTIAKMRSRTALTSGGLAPVLDGGGGGHSVFAKAFLEVLAGAQEIMEGQRLYREVAARVAFEANRYQVEQVPEYAPIKYAGHESGDFLFIPKS